MTTYMELSHHRHEAVSETKQVYRCEFKSKDDMIWFTNHTRFYLNLAKRDGYRLQVHFGGKCYDIASTEDITLLRNDINVRTDREIVGMIGRITFLS